MNAWECNHAVVVFQWVVLIFLSCFFSEFSFVLFKMFFSLGTVHCSECFLFYFYFEGLNWVYGNMFVVVLELWWLKFKNVRRIDGHGLNYGILSNEREMIMLYVCTELFLLQQQQQRRQPPPPLSFILSINILLYTTTNLRSNLNEKGRQNELFIG